MKILSRVLFILILFTGTGCQSIGIFTGTDFVEIEGIVRDSSGDPIPGIIVETEGYQVETDNEGRFSLNNLQRGTVRLDLHGEKGTGRYSVDLHQSNVFLALEYPVKTTIVLLHDNDLHFNYNQKDEFVEKIEEIRSRFENVWLLNAGDTFVRHAHRWAIDDTMYYAERSRYMIENMNAVGYDLGVPGNHEIDYVGSHSGQSLNRADFPLIAANINVATGKLPQFKPFLVFETSNGLSVAILGLTTVNFDKPGISARDPAETAVAYRNLAREHDLFVALTHIGLSQDEIVAEAVPELDVIVGGHSHTLLETAKTVNGVLIAQAGGPPPEHQVDPDWPKYLGKVTVVLENDTIVEKSGHVITLKSMVNAH